MTFYTEIVEKNPPTSVNRMDEVFQIIKIAPPASFRNFLLATNGGRPKRCLFEIENFYNNPIGRIKAFLCIDDTYEMSDLLQVNQLYQGGFPQGVLAIANTSGLDLILLDLRGSGQRVVYMSFAHFWSTGEWREMDIYNISKSFEQFLISLREPS